MVKSVNTFRGMNILFRGRLLVSLASPGFVPWPGFRMPYAYRPFFQPPSPEIDPAALLSPAERKFLVMLVQIGWEKQLNHVSRGA